MAPPQPRRQQTTRRLPPSRAPPAARRRSRWRSGAPSGWSRCRACRGATHRRRVAARWHPDARLGACPE
eukprot:scaffold50768_cov54-Phaeocystis_antarctica.AAC.3